VSFVSNNNGRILTKFDGLLSVHHVKNGAVRSKIAERTYTTTTRTMTTTMMMMMIAPVGPSFEGRM
jgi:hypothetical protein